MGGVRSDLMRTFLKTTRESDCVMKSLLSFFSRFWGSFSLFFFVSLSLFCVARARAVSLFLFFFRRGQRTRVEKKISAMLWTMMMKIRDSLNVCVDVQKDRCSDLSPGQTRFFLYLL